MIARILFIRIGPTGFSGAGVQDPATVAGTFQYIQLPSEEWFWGIDGGQRFSINPDIPDGRPNRVL